MRTCATLLIMDVFLVFFPAPARLYQSVIDGIKRRIGPLGDLQIVDYEIDESTLKRLLKFWKPCGCIYDAPMGMGKISHASFGGIPIVYLDRTPFPDGYRLDVLQDYAENGQIAARELLQLEMPTYAFVGYKERTYWSQARGKAFVDAIRLHRKPCHVFAESEPNGNRLTQLERWLINLPKPVGVFAANDMTAHEIITICNRNHIAIPRDIALLGIDNVTDICEKTLPTLSSIHSDFEQGGWQCADLLLERLAKPHLRRAVRTYPTLGVIVRESTGKTHGFNNQILRAVNIIRTRACEGLTVDDVASDMGCSRRMAEIKFMSATHMTIKNAITDAKLDRAKVLLKDRNIPLVKIVASCGYGTENALRIAFKKKFGISLRQGREKTY